MFCTAKRGRRDLILYARTVWIINNPSVPFYTLENMVSTRMNLSVKLSTSSNMSPKEADLWVQVKRSGLSINSKLNKLFQPSFVMSEVLTRRSSRPKKPLRGFWSSELIR
jgi:hypothetical protein